MIFSGVNRGSNLAEDVTYSGTVAGAIEGTLMGIRAIAFSQVSAFGRPGGPPWQTARTHGPKVVDHLLGQTWRDGVFMNVNFPDCEPDEVNGIAITHQGKRMHARLGIDARKDTWDQPYYWLAYQFQHSEPPQGTDLNAVFHHQISISPLNIDFYGSRKPCRHPAGGIDATACRPALTHQRRNLAAIATQSRTKKIFGEENRGGVRWGQPGEWSAFEDAARANAERQPVHCMILANTSRRR